MPVLLKAGQEMHSTTNILAFREFCILIYFYIKSQRDALFLKFIFGIEMYMFGTDLLAINRSLNTVYTAREPERKPGKHGKESGQRAKKLQRPDNIFLQFKTD
jgi:hypothetical protein